ASLAAKGSSSSIPYIDCSDIDSEYDLVKGCITTPRSRTHDNDEVEPVGRIAGKSNGYGSSPQIGNGAIRSRFRESPLTSHRLVQSSDTFNGSQSSNGSFCGNGSPRVLPFSSTLVDEMFQGSDRHGPKSPTGHVVASRSANCSPVLSSFHKTSNCPEQIGCSGRRFWDDGSRYLSKGRSGGEAQHYGSYSPIVSRSPHLQKLHNGMRNRSDTDPMILSQLSSTPANKQRPAGSRAKRIATVEQRVSTNGHGQAPSNIFQQHYGSRPSANDHNSPVQMIDGSTSSGTESSDTESDAGSHSYSQPLVFSNPAAAGSSRSKFLFGSLADEGQGREDDYLHPVNNEKGAQFFNC
ncbi:uncharacterized protein, partial [Misgurnus anguillicaudatus]|uniref:uncharacterized protein n=1 Tax=Misgurnus anguillicaudatus TaxID=75329 RepID=UPI003CCFA4B2